MFRSQKVYEVCFRAREGLPLPARPLSRLIIQSALARTQRDDKVQICAYMWMANHTHILLVSRDVTALKNFYGELQKRVTDMTKRLLGMTTLNLWEDKPARVIEILDLEKAKKSIAYYFLNPVEAGLVESVDHYPGESTWASFKSCEARVDAWSETSVPWIRLPSIEPLRNACPTPSDEIRIINQIKANNKSLESFKVHPFGWLKVFGITTKEDIETIKQQVIGLVRTGEEEFKQKRQREKTQVAGAVKLLLAGITTKGFKPKKNERSVYFLSSCRELRIQFHLLYKEFCARCRECYKLACQGAKDIAWPDGAFLPSIPPMVNPIEFVM